MKAKVILLGILIIVLSCRYVCAMENSFPESGATRVIGQVYIIDTGWDLKENDFSEGSIICTNILEIENRGESLDVLIFQYLPKGVKEVSIESGNSSIGGVLQDKEKIEFLYTAKSKSEDTLKIITMYDGIKIMGVSNEDGVFVGPNGDKAYKKIIKFKNTSEFYEVKGVYNTHGEKIFDIENNLVGDGELYITLEPNEEVEYVLYTKSMGKDYNIQMIIMLSAIFSAIAILAYIYITRRKRGR